MKEEQIKENARMAAIIFLVDSIFYFKGKLFFKLLKIIF
jgi:hypothetical protein